MKLKIFTFIISFLMIFTISSVTLNATESEYIAPNVITQASSVEEDMALLGIDLSEIEAGTDKDDRILTFGNLYYEQSGNILNEIVMYYYSPNFKLSYDYLYVDLEATYLENYGVGSNVANWPTGISCWKIIKISELGIYKLKYDSECYTGNNPITELIKIFDKVQFTTHAIGTSVARVSKATETNFSSNGFVVAKNQHFQLLNEFNSEDNIRSFSSVGYDEEYIIVDGVCVGYTFDMADPWLWGMNYQDNMFDLYFCYFNVSEDGIKWTDTKSITKVKLTYTEQEIIETVASGKTNPNIDIASNIMSLTTTSKGDVTAFEQTINNDNYSFTYPAETSSFKEWFSSGLYTDKKLTYKGIWSLNDSDWNEALSNSSNYNADNYSDYTFALHYGSMEGYTRTKTTEQLGTYTENLDGSTTTYYSAVKNSENYTKAIIEDFLEITYTEAGESYVVSVDETNIEFGGWTNSDDAPVTTEDDDPWWLKLWNMFLDWINNLLNKPAVKTIVIILICVAAIVLVFSIWSKVATIQALRKKK